MRASEHGYARQKFCEAVDSLVGSRPIQERLTFAAIPLIQLRAPQPSHVPPSIAEEFHAVLDLLTKTPVGADAPPRQVTAEEGEKLARRILRMFVEVQGGIWLAPNLQ